MRHLKSVARWALGLSRLAPSVLFALTAVACGPGYKVLPSDVGGEHPRLRDSTIARMGGCVEQYAKQISPGAYRLDLRMKVTQDGEFERRTVTGPEGPSVHLELQMCMRIALRAAALPEEVYHAAPVTPESRKHLGVAQAAGALVGLAPIMIVAAGVTITVYVVVVVTEEVAEAAKRNRKLEKMCRARMDACLDTRPGICGECFRFCLKQEYWPDHACP